MIIVELAGHLGVDAETRFTPNGQKVTTLRLAVNVRKGGNSETVWWRVTMWGDRFDSILPYLKKGTGLIVIGEMRGKPTTYVDKNGQQQPSLEITAEIVRFSPFGRQNAGEEKVAHSSPFSSTAANPAAPAPSFDSPIGGTSSFGEGGFSAGASQPTSPGASEEKSPAGFSNEDSIPF